MGATNTAAGQPPGPVIVVGAGPVGATAALLLADAGIGVIMLERHAEPHPLPRAVHLDDEVARILYRGSSYSEACAIPTGSQAVGSASDVRRRRSQRDRGRTSSQYLWTRLREALIAVVSLPISGSRAFTFCS